MIQNKKILLIGIGLLAISCFAQKPVQFKTHSVGCDPSSGTLWMFVTKPIPIRFLSSAIMAFIFETDLEGKIMRQIKQPNTDFEAVYTDNQFIYAIDENAPGYLCLRFDFPKKIRVVNVPYSGGRNKGYEAIAFNKSKNSFVVITERDPITLFELDANFKITNQIDLAAIAHDISSAYYYQDALWLLSDEDMMLLKLNPQTYEVLQKWALPVINPEGFTFDRDGNLIIACDDMQRLYYFNNPEKN